MDIFEAVYQRRSIRNYKDIPVEENVLEEIIEAGTWAPSGVNLQPWFFAVIRSKEQLKKMREVMERVSKRIEPDLKKRFEKHPSVVEDTTRFIRSMGGAPVCILAFRMKPDYADKADMVNLSIAAAMENILLAATGKGLGTCWLTAPVEAEVGQELKNIFAAGKGELVGMITMGYPVDSVKTLKPPLRKEGRYEFF